MSQTELYGLSGVFIFFCCMMAYFWHSKKIENLQKQAITKVNELNKALMHNSGQISVLEKQVQSLSQEKNRALQQYHAADALLQQQYDATNSLLAVANQVKKQQDDSHKQQIDELQSNIKALEEKMNLAIGNYQAERRRNLITEKAHVQDTLNQLSVIEKNLVASQQAFTKPLAKGMN